MPGFTDIELASYMRTKAVWYLCRWIGTPYLWGGDDFSGWDCSGLAIEMLKSVGILPHDFDDTAHGLYLRFKNKKVETPYQGCLVFWLKDGKAIHVEIVIDDYHTVGASGGGSRTMTREDAVKHNAFVKMRPVGYRGDAYKICDPFMAKEIS